MAAGDHQVPIATFPAAEVVVVIVPFVAHGHLNQLLHLSHRISAYNLPVHFVGTTNHLRQVRHRHRTSAAYIHFHEFPTPPFTSPPPDPSIPFPTHLQPSFDSTIHLRRPIAALLRSLSHTVKRIAIVHDILMSYVVQDAKFIPNAETYVFQPPSAFYRCCSHHRENSGEPFPIDPELLNRIPSQDGIFSPEFLKFVNLQRSHLNFHVGELYDSSREIEGKFIKYLERIEISGEKKIWAIGPINQVHIASDVTVSENRHKCLLWLDKQATNSVIYVSFGTTTTFSDAQIRELAIGLEKSEQRFIWVVRAADIGDVSGFTDRTVELPNRFEERVKDRGFIERGWAPQLEILRHFATGGFMSHCGWNSTMESISMGVPMATWPMHSDQPRNAFLITDILRIGVGMKDWERRKELVTAMVVEEAVKTLMCSKEGEEMRQRAAELGSKVERSVAKGGISCNEMNSFISYICR